MIVHDLILATRRAKLTGIERFAINVFEAARSSSSDVVALVAPGSVLSGSSQVIEVGSVFGGWMRTAETVRKLGRPRGLICAAFPASPSLLLSSVPIVRVIHDAFAWTRPQNLTLQGRLMFAHWDRLMLRRYHHLFAPTEIARREVAEALAISDIEVCGNAPGQDWQAAAERPARELPPKSFILAVGTVEPRKNYERLIAFLKATKGEATVVVVGRPGWGSSAQRITDAAKVLGSKLLWLDDANDAELRWLYRNCAAFISLSHAEGFNMPLVEAGVSGCPIVCSDIPIHRDVAPAWARFVASSCSDSAIEDALFTPTPPEDAALSSYRRRFDWSTVAERLQSPLRPAL